MPLRHRLAAALVLFAVGALGIGGWLVYRSSRSLLERELDTKLEAVAVAAASGLDGGLASQLRRGDEGTRLFQAYRARLRSLAPVSSRAFVADTAGRLLVPSWDGAEIGDPVRVLSLYGAELKRAIDAGTATTMLFRGEDGRWYKLGFAKLDGGPALLTVEMPASFMVPLRALRNGMISFALVALVAVVLGAGLLSRRLTGTLEELADSARRIGEGDWTTPVRTGAGGEVGQLANAMEEMRIAIIRREEELRMMLAQVAHEIRNPLGGIELFAGAAADGLPEGDERRGHLDRIRSEAKELDRVIGEFLAFARPQAPNVRRSDLRAPLKEAAEVVSAVSGDVRIEMNLPADPIWAEVDPEQVKRIAVNLLRNAVTAARSSVRLSASTDEDGPGFSIADDGPGIPEEIRERIFEPFFTTRADGAGLGLAIVRRLAEANEGRVELDHRAGATRFVVTFSGNDVL